MRLSASNIAWPAREDAGMYRRLPELGFKGLEIAPSRLWGMPVYEKTKEATDYADRLQQDYGLSIPSMQSIWFGRTEKMFRSQEEFDILLEYTERAVDFAAACSCRNLVFGCPKNRWIYGKEQYKDALSFFDRIGGYAEEHGVALALEANPPIYGTNFVNGTDEAFRLVEQLDRPGIRVNLDTGTMIENGESCSALKGRIRYVSHVHISEPQLVPIRKRSLHAELAALLREEGYRGYVSVEMKDCGDMQTVYNVLEYVRDILEGDE